MVVGMKAAFHQPDTPAPGAVWLPSGATQDSWTCRSDEQRPDLGGGDTGLGCLKWVSDKDHLVLWTECFEWQVCGTVISESQMEWI